MLYDELPFWSAPFGLVLLDTVRLRKRMLVLDIGCGAGFPMLELAGRLDGDSHVTGLDPSDEAVEMVQEKIAVIGGIPPEISMLLKHMILSHTASTNLARPNAPKLSKRPSSTTWMISIQRSTVSGVISAGK